MANKIECCVGELSPERKKFLDECRNFWCDKHPGHMRAVCGECSKESKENFDLKDAITTNYSSGKPKKKLLFLDDNGYRIKKALEMYSMYDVTVVTNVKDCLKELSFNHYDYVSLDNDLGGKEMVSPWEDDCGTEVVRRICADSDRFKDTFFIIHTSNKFAADEMELLFEIVELEYKVEPFGWKEYQKGIVIGAFSLIHPGYIRLLKEAKEWCHKVVVALHVKDEVIPWNERKEILLALRYVDEVYEYYTEDQLDKLLKWVNPDVRILGSDHEGQTTRPEWKTIYHKRNHNWSASHLKHLIAMNYSNKWIAKYTSSCKECRRVAIPVNEDYLCEPCYFLETL